MTQVETSENMTHDKWFWHLLPASELWHKFKQQVKISVMTKIVWQVKYDSYEQNGLRIICSQAK